MDRGITRMKEIKDFLYKLIRNDATFKSLTGADSKDPRIYFFYPPDDVVVSDEKPCYVTYYLGAGAGLPDPHVNSVQRPDEVYTFDIWGKDIDVIEDVFERIDALFFETNRFETSGYRILRASRERQNDLPDPDDEFRRKIVEYRIGHIMKK
ncbi:MAG: hypothetical protein AB1401_00510 [Thermodesulfobacteriota bacterium]